MIRVTSHKGLAKFFRASEVTHVAQSTDKEDFTIIYFRNKGYIYCVEDAATVAAQIEAAE